MAALKVLILKLIFTLLALFLAVNQTASQHNHKKGEDGDYESTILFSNSSDLREMSLTSSSYPLVSDKKVVFNLSISLLDSKYKLDRYGPTVIVKGNKISPEKLRVEKQNDSESIHSFEYIFNEMGTFDMVISFGYKDSNDLQRSESVKFTIHVSETIENHDSHHGFMGMGTEIWIIMGAMMLAMAVIVMGTAGHR